MNKLGLGVGVAVVAGVAALPMVSGYFGQKALTQEIERIEEPGVEVSLKQMERGYLSSSAVTVIEVTDPQMIAELTQEDIPTRFEFTHQFTHGLFSVTGDTRLAYSEEQKEMIAELWGDNLDPIRMQTVTNWQGQTEFDFTVDEFTFSADGTEVNWQAFNATGSGQANGAVEFQLQWPGAVIKDDLETVRIEQVKASGDGELKYGMWLGEQRFSLERIEIESSELSAALSQFTGVMINEQDGDSYGGSSELKLAQLQVGERKVENLELNFNAKGFDAKAVETLSANQALSNAEEVQAFTGALDQLIARGFELQVQPLSADLPEGALLGEVKLQVLPGLEKASQMPFAVMQQVDGAVQLSLPVALLENPLWSEELGSLVQMGFLVPEDNSLVLNASIKPGEAPQLNGQPLPM